MEAADTAAVADTVTAEDTDPGSADTAAPAAVAPGTDPAAAAVVDIETTAAAVAAATVTGLVRTGIEDGG